jgi:hypothetical protein
MLIIDLLTIQKLKKMKTERRSVLKKLFASVAGLAGFGIAANANVVILLLRRKLEK